MTWIRKDDQMPIHRKVAPLSDAAYRLMDEAMCWASRNLTDGRIGAGELSEISKRGKEKLADELVARELWHQADYSCPSPMCPPPGPDGWVIHDYLDYNPSKEKVRRERAAKADRQQKWLNAKRGGGDASKDASRDASQDTSIDASKDATPSRPVPPRPERGRERGSRSDHRPPQRGEPGGGGREKQTPGGDPPSPATAPPDLTGVRAVLAEASRKSRVNGNRREGALDELRALTDPEGVNP